MGRKEGENQLHHRISVIIDHRLNTGFFYLYCLRLFAHFYTGWCNFLNYCIKMLGFKAFLQFTWSKESILYGFTIGNVIIKSWMFASLAALMTSSMGTSLSLSPYAMFSRMLVSNRMGSCCTMPICCRTHCRFRPSRE